MTPALKPIETYYAGCRFRSRIEARWAVFMDQLNISWEYEAEGFELPSGRYLPDFRAWQGSCWLEVKGAFPSAEEQQLARELALASGMITYIAYGGIPRTCDVGNPWLVIWPTLELCPPDLPIPQFQFPFFFGFYGRCGHDESRLPRSEVNVALAAARSARFEHGENPGMR